MSDALSCQPPANVAVAVALLSTWQTLDGMKITAHLAGNPVPLTCHRHPHHTQQISCEPCIEPSEPVLHFVATVSHPVIDTLHHCCTLCLDIATTTFSCCELCKPHNRLKLQQGLWLAQMQMVCLAGIADLWSCGCWKSMDKLASITHGWH